MAQLAWGMKRTCSGCGIHFYDFWKNPAPCPKCATPFEIQLSGKGKRSLKAVLKDLDMEHDQDHGLDEGLSDDLEKEDLDGGDILDNLKGEL